MPILFAGSGFWTANNVSSGSSSSVNYTVPQGDNRLLLVAISLGGGNTSVTSVTFGGQALTSLSTADAGTNARAELWYLVNPPLGTASVAITMGGTSSFAYGVAAYVGVHQTTPFGTPVTNTGASGDTSLTVSSATGELVLDVLSMQNDTGLGIETLGAATRRGRLNQAPFGVPATDHAILGVSESLGTASTVMDWSRYTGPTSTMWAQVGVAIKPAAGLVCYSCGDSTANLETGSATVDMMGWSAIFNTAQTGNIGIGDVIDYDTDNKKAYIIRKMSTTEWYVVTATGAAPPQGGSWTVNSIKHTFTSLKNAMDGWNGASYLNGGDLNSKNVAVKLCCYYDGGSHDSTEVYKILPTITGDAERYFEVYVPYDTVTESNNRQRHYGYWDESKYALIVNTPVSGVGAFEIVGSLADTGTVFKVTGLQAKHTADGYDGIKENVYGGTSPSVIWRDCIGWSSNNASGYGNGFSVLNTSTSGKHIFINCIGLTGGTLAGAAGISCNRDNSSFYNCIAWGGYRAVDGTASRPTIVFKNCAIGGAANADVVGGTDGTNWTNNAFERSTGFGSNARTSQTFAWRNLAACDLRIPRTNAAMRHHGINLSTDSVYPFTTDIAGQTRGVLWDIGPHAHPGYLTLRFTGV